MNYLDISECKDHKCNALAIAKGPLRDSNLGICDRGNVIAPFCNVTDKPHDKCMRESQNRS